MDFFENEIVRSESAELMEIYEDLRSLMMSSRFHSEEGGLEYINLLERLLELQEMLYFRAKYSNEDDAKEFVEMLSRTLPFVAKEGETDASQVFRRMREEIADLKKLIGDP